MRAPNQLEEIQPSWLLDGLGITGEQTDRDHDDDTQWDLMAWTRDEQDQEDFIKKCCESCCGLTVSSITVDVSVSGTFDPPCDTCTPAVDCTASHTWIAGIDFTPSCEIVVFHQLFLDVSNDCVTCPAPCDSNLIRWDVAAEITNTLVGAGTEFEAACLLFGLPQCSSGLIPFSETTNGVCQGMYVYTGTVSGFNFSITLTIT